jgi:hypothetical protein
MAESDNNYHNLISNLVDVVQQFTSKNLVTSAEIIGAYESAKWISMRDINKTLDRHEKQND